MESQREAKDGGESGEFGTNHRESLGECSEKLTAKKMRNGQQSTNRQRSVNWVRARGTEFENVYDANSHRVFWRGNAGTNGKKDGLLLTELLFDVTVAEIGYVESVERNSRKLPFVAKCKWAVESEFDTGKIRQILLDLSKLVMASAENKLLVVSQRSLPETDRRIKERCAEIVKRSTGGDFLAFVAHPSTWGNIGKEPLTVLNRRKILGYS